jgi:LPS sulfotransferase NodH
MVEPSALHNGHANVQEIRTEARAFLVGCPRSGTTLLQSLLAAHTKIHSFPESHFFTGLDSPNRWFRTLGIAPLQAKQRFVELLRNLGRPDMECHLPAWSIFTTQYVKAFNYVLDTVTENEGKTIWLEKTPGHLHHIDRIERIVKGVAFIHIVRSGSDVVASLYEVTKKYPDVWHGPWSIDRCIKQWCDDAAISISHLQKHNHALIKYEALVNDPELVLKQLCEFLCIEFERAMLREYVAAAKNVSLPTEPWKKSVGGEIFNANTGKFGEVFDERQQKYILDQISEATAKMNQLQDVELPRHIRVRAVKD